MITRCSAFSHVIASPSPAIASGVVPGEGEPIGKGFRVAIRHPATSVTVTVPDGLSASSLALAQTQLAGIYVTSAVPDPANGTLRIHLNKTPATSSRPATVTIAWFILS